MTSPIDITFPQYAQAGTKYRMRIVSTSPSATSSLSGYLSTDGQSLSISVKNLVGKDIFLYTTICEGSALTGIISSNQSGVIYEWKKNGVSQNTNSTLRMTQSGNYIASVQKSGCNKVNTSLNITFSNASINYTQAFGSGFQCLGDSMQLGNTYFSDSATYQWKKDGMTIIGQSNNNLIIKQTGFYNSVINDKCPVRDYEGVKIIFSNIIVNDPLFLKQSPLQINLCGSATYSLLDGTNSNNNNPFAPFSYQWKKNGQSISGETNRTLYVNSEGIYSLALTQGNCTAISLGIPVIKVDTFKLKLKVREEYSSEICQGLQTLIAANPLEGMNVSFYKDGVPLISPEIYFPYSTFVGETGKYTISGTSPGCTVLVSDSLKITVGNKLKPNLYGESRTICNGREIYLGAIIFNGSENWDYQWFRNGLPMPFGTNFGIIISQSGTYKVRATSGSCTGFSDSVQIKVLNTLPKPQILIDNSDISSYTSKIQLCENNIIRLFGHAYTLNFLDMDLTFYDTLTWKRNGQKIGQVGNYEDFLITQSGTYTVIGKQGTCQTESDPVEIKIGEPITANITGSTSIYPGQKAKLNLNFTGGNAWSYQTSDVVTGQTTTLSPTLKNVSPSNTQTYSITSVASNCGIGTVTGNATVTVLSCPTDKTISLNSGNWNTATTWTCGQIPTAAYDAIIENGHTVTLPNGYQGETKKLDLRGGLKQGVGASLKVNQ
jgi:trimeric autotransporter adhesin